MKTVYLCGAIHGCSDAEAHGWRLKVKNDLHGLFRFLDPMRRDYRGKGGEHDAEIVEGDLRDIDASDIVLVAADRPSWGTAMEVFYAHRAGVHVVCVCGDDASPWLRHHVDEILPDLDDAIAYLWSVA